MLRAHPLSGSGIYRIIPSWRTPPLHQCSNFTTYMAIEKAKESASNLEKESMSPADIASVMHQHIAFGTKLWEVGEERTALNTRPVERSTRDEVLQHGFVKPLRGRSTSAGLPLKRRPRVPTSTAAELEALADDLEAHATTTSCVDALPRMYRRQSLRPRLLATLANTQDVACAWAAYRALVILPRSPDKAAPKVPFPHRHRLLRLLAAAPPRPLRTRGRFAQILSVLRALQNAGGTVQTWEWNLLLDCAGKEGWRRPREEHFRAALALLAEMRRHEGGGDRGGGGGGGAGTALNATTPAAGGGRSRDADGGGAGLEPDIFSYTTLLAHAVRTRSPAAVRHSAQLLARAGLAPGVHAHTALLCFFAQRGDLAGVRDMLFRLRRHAHAEAGPGLTQASFNAVLWAFAYNGRLDVAQAMYRVVRGRLLAGGSRRPPTEAEEEHEEEREEELELELEPELEELERALAEREMIVIAHEVVPDTATYHTLILAYSYHGDLRASLATLRDMLSAPPASALASPPSSPLSRERRLAASGQGGFIASLPAFRAIFLGFARHGVVDHPSSTPSSSSSPSRRNYDHPTSPRRLTPTFTSQKYRDDHHHPEQRRRSHHPFTTSHRHHRHHRPLLLVIDGNAHGGESEWTLQTLEALFARFLELPRDTRLREPTLFWLVSAFARTSGRDPAVLRRVFERVEDRFPTAIALTRGGAMSQRGRLARIRDRVFSTFDS